MSEFVTCPDCGERVSYRGGVFYCHRCIQHLPAPGTVAVGDFAPMAAAFRDLLATHPRVVWDEEQDAPIYVFPNGKTLALNTTTPNCRGAIKQIVHFHPPVQTPQLQDLLGALSYYQHEFRRLRRFHRAPEVAYDCGPDLPAYLTRPGYNEPTQTWYLGPPIEPQKNGSFQRLLDQLAFRDDHSRSAYAAFVYGLFSPDRAFPAPILLLNARREGAGKTEALKLLLMLYGAGRSGFLTWSDVKTGGKAARRTVVGKVLDGCRLVGIDNVVGRAASDFLASLATSDEIVADALYRIGTTSAAGLYCAITANNAVLNADLMERTVSVFMDAETAKSASSTYEGMETWTERRRELLADITAHLLANPPDGRHVNGAGRFPRWWSAVTTWVPELTVPVSEEHDISQAAEELRELDHLTGRQFTLEEAWLAASRNPAQFADLLANAQNEVAFSERFPQYVGRSYMTMAAVVTLVTVGEKFEFIRRNR